MYLNVVGCWAQVEDRTHGDANYSSSLSVVTVEPGGHTGDHAKKIRLLLVRIITISRLLCLQ